MLTAKKIGLTLQATSAGYSFGHNVGEIVQSCPENLNGVVIYVFNTEEQATAFEEGLVTATGQSHLSVAGTSSLGLPAVIREIDEYSLYQEYIQESGAEEDDILVSDCTRRDWAIYSPNEAAAGGGSGGFWNNEDGWVDKESATLFSSLKKLVLPIPESTGNDARWVKMLLDVGMADAVATSDDADNCGDAAKFAEEAVKLEIGSSRPKEARTSELIGYWDGIHYHEGGDTETEGLSFECEIHDMRSTNGQVTVDIVPESGSLDDGLYTTLEINRLNGSRDECPCLHVAFDGDNMAFSLYKQGDKIILKLEADVEIRSTVLPDGKAAFIID